MSDIIERLRTRPTGDPYLHVMVHEAADEIERLRAEVAALREDAARLDFLLHKLPGDALRYTIGELSDTSDEAMFRTAIDAARAKGGA